MPKKNRALEENSHEVEVMAIKKEADEAINAVATIPDRNVGNPDNEVLTEWGDLAKRRFDLIKSFRQAGDRILEQILKKEENNQIDDHYNALGVEYRRHLLAELKSIDDSVLKWYDPSKALEDKEIRIIFTIEKEE